MIAYRYSRPVQWLVKLIEDEPQDDRLYDATFPIGRELNDTNYKELARKLAEIDPESGAAVLAQVAQSRATAE